MSASPYAPLALPLGASNSNLSDSSASASTQSDSVALTGVAQAAIQESTVALTAYVAPSTEPSDASRTAQPPPTIAEIPPQETSVLVPFNAASGTPTFSATAAGTPAFAATLAPEISFFGDVKFKNTYNAGYEFNDKPTNQTECNTAYKGIFAHLKAKGLNPPFASDETPVGSKVNLETGVCTIFYRKSGVAGLQKKLVSLVPTKEDLQKIWGRNPTTAEYDQLIADGKAALEKLREESTHNFPNKKYPDLKPGYVGDKDGRSVFSGERSGRASALAALSKTWKNAKTWFGEKRIDTVKKHVKTACGAAAEAAVVPKVNAFRAMCNRLKKSTPTELERQKKILKGITNPVVHAVQQKKVNKLENQNELFNSSEGVDHALTNFGLAYYPTHPAEQDLAHRQLNAKKAADDFTTILEGEKSFNFNLKALIPKSKESFYENDKLKPEDKQYAKNVIVPFSQTPESFLSKESSLEDIEAFSHDAAVHGLKSTPKRDLPVDALFYATIALQNGNHPLAQQILAKHFGPGEGHQLYNEAIRAMANTTDLIALN